MIPMWPQKLLLPGRFSASDVEKLFENKIAHQWLNPAQSPRLQEE
jgi:hypothetical protein